MLFLTTDNSGGIEALYVNFFNNLFAFVQYIVSVCNGTLHVTLISMHTSTMCEYKQTPYYIAHLVPTLCRLEKNDQVFSKNSNSQCREKMFFNNAKCNKKCMFY